MFKVSDLSLRTLVFIIFHAPTVMAGNDGQMQIVPAWNGYLKPEKASEIVIFLSSKNSETITVESGRFSIEQTVTANEPAVIHMPILAGSGDSLTVRAFAENRDETLNEQTISLLPSSFTGIALVSNGLSFAERNTLARIAGNGEVKLISIDGQSLPRFGIAYQTIDVIVMHYDGLRALSREQIDAFTGFIAQCGAMVALQWPAQLFAELKDSAGCAGQFIHPASSIEEAGNHLRDLVKQTPHPLPLPRKLAMLKQPIAPARPALTAFAFCATYLLILGIVALVNKSTLIFFAVPLIMTFGAILLWFKQQASTSLVSWIDMDNGHNVARYQAVFAIHGAGKDWKSLSLPLVAALSADNGRLTYHLSDGAYRHVDTKLRLSLLSRHEWSWRGATRLTPPLSIEMEPQTPLVTNVGGSATPAGFLLWRSQLYRLPALTGGQTWRPQSSPAQPIKDKLAAMLKEYGTPYKAAVVVPFSKKLMPFAVDHQGWLLLHTNDSGGPT